MGRVIFPEGEQQKWIDAVITTSGKSVEELAGMAKVHPRTFRDWRRGKCSIPEITSKILGERFVLPLPPNVKHVGDYWYVSKGARKGALRRMELYGSPGTPEGRRKGGKRSQLKRKLYPHLYQNCRLAKNYVALKKSEMLAEVVGIILGDGGISDYQVKVTLNSVLEKDYLSFVSSLFRDVFGEIPQRHNGHVSKKDCNLCISGVNLVKRLESVGLKRGNKVENQVGVPHWISNNQKYSVTCLRGLIDTDGCVFLHDHVTHGIRCLNIGMCFSNYSQPLLDFVHSILVNLGYAAKRRSSYVFLYRESEVVKYEREIGFSNSHHKNRLIRFLERKHNII